MIACLVFALQQPDTAPADARTYSAWLETPGGRLEFRLDLEHEASGAWRATLGNGEERIEVPEVSFDGNELTLEMPHYDSRIHARVLPASDRDPRASGKLYTEERLEGQWEKRRSAEQSARLAFFAQRPAMIPYGPRAAQEISGRWRVSFETDEQPSVAIFQPAADGFGVRGTFLTSTGDYRYLAGWWGTQLTLSCFDGAHAFLFRAKLQPDGTLAGDFWSGDWHHETWTAKRDESAALADPFAQTKWNGTTKLPDLVFPDLDGVKRSLGDFAGRATLLVVLGSWCPNCNDEAKLLAELDATYRARGLRILGLAFELTGEFARDAEQVRIFRQRHGLDFPFFLCGTADKAEATKALGLVDRVRAFPTTVFVGADGLPRAVHSGFAGPATGAEHQELRRDFAARIEALLGPR